MKMLGNKAYNVHLSKEVGTARMPKLEYIQGNFTGFAELNRSFVNLFFLSKLQESNRTSLLANTTAIFSQFAGYIVVRFIAFAYTYHYLNWFSKILVIQWHKVPRKTVNKILGIWLMSIAIYVYDYMLGLKWLFLLSFLHFLLEFALNNRSIIGSGTELKEMVSPKQMKHA